MHSALKHQGRPLYEYARAGIEIERPPRKVQIRALERVECDPPRVVLDVQCSAGTYIRTLAQDIGAALGCGAHLTALTRSAAGGFRLAQAHTLAELEALDASQRPALLLPADCLVAHLPAVQLDAPTLRRCARAAAWRTHDASGLTRVYAAPQHLHRPGRCGRDAGRRLMPRRLIATQQA
jgi:tRNA pseudouridine55 synthase